MSLTGSLDLASVPALMPRADQLAASGRLDVSGVTAVDSAGVAFLLELQRRARRQGKDLVISGAGNRLRQLAVFFEVDSLLQLN
ncbi:MAG TPA: STAS domain-containing protein [Solimonas sp.]|nr:STAS domain-containing protein [Solimonas sp.]